MLVPMIDLLNDAKKEGYAVGSFDFHNLEMATGIVQAAIDNNSPVILAVPESNFDIQNFEALMAAVRELALNTEIPIAILLDHGRSVESCIRAIKAGVTSVMFDGSDMPFEQNIQITKQVVQHAHPVGITVEAEIGHVAQPGLSLEEIQKLVTKPEDAIKFVRETDIDCLAVAVGTIHGHYKGTPQIRFELLDEIANHIQIPLVLHGGSSTGTENIQKAIKLGITKVNIYTDMATEAKQRIQDQVNNNPNSRINDYLISTRESFYEVASKYMKLFGSAGRASDFPFKKKDKLYGAVSQVKIIE